MPPTSRNRNGRLGEHTLPLALAGIGLWVIGALIVRVLPGVFESRWQTLAALLLAIPAAEVLLIGLGALLGIERAKRLPAAAWIGIVVVACHALAMVVWPDSYGPDALAALRGSAWLGWMAVAPTLCAWIAFERK